MALFNCLIHVALERAAQGSDGVFISLGQLLISTAVAAIIAF
jgi:hypothetical protein